MQKAWEGLCVSFLIPHVITLYVPSFSFISSPGIVSTYLVLHGYLFINLNWSISYCLVYNKCRYCYYIVNSISNFLNINLMELTKDCNSVSMILALNKSTTEPQFMHTIVKEDLNRGILTNVFRYKRTKYSLKFFSPLN